MCPSAGRKRGLFAIRAGANLVPRRVAANLRLLRHGLLLVVMMHLRPQGRADEYRVR